MADLREYVRTANPALILHPSGRRLSFRDVDDGANRLAWYLRYRGVTPGDTVAVLMENNEHIHVVMWAARRSGLRYTLINSSLTASEAAYIIHDCQARALISSRALRDVCSQLHSHLPRGLPPVVLLADGDLDGWQRYPDCVAGQPAKPLPEEHEGELLQYSAGSTGRPKGIRRLAATTASARPSLPTPVFEALGVSQDSVYLSPAPTYHTAPAMWTMSAQAVGATVIMMETFDAKEALECIDRYHVTHAQFVPTMFVRMLRLPAEVRAKFRLSSLKRVIHAAAPCSPAIKRQMLDWWGPIIDEYYGSSEGAGTSLIRAEEWLRRPGSVGKPIIGTPHVLDIDGYELRPGQIGDIYFDGGLPFEYLNDGAKTAASRSPQGWVTVGDIGFVDEDGYLYLTDRRHHMIISGGVNIYPREIEDVIVSHPLVVDAAVFGVPDYDLGQTVMAVAELGDPAAACETTSEELMSWIRERLARHKWPRRLVLEQRLPRTDAGKLYKNELIQKYARKAMPEST